jgi:hypothetical protein
MTKPHYATVASFAAADHGFVLGQLRSMTWQTLELVTQEDIDARKGNGAVWAERCDRYWERQMRKFGVVMSEFVIMVDQLDGRTVVTTSAAVLAILPGDRTRS